MKRFRWIPLSILGLFRIWSVAARLLAVATGKTVPVCGDSKRHFVEDGWHLCSMHSLHRLSSDTVSPLNVIKADPPTLADGTIQFLYRFRYFWTISSNWKVVLSSMSSSMSSAYLLIIWLRWSASIKLRIGSLPSVKTSFTSFPSWYVEIHSSSHYSKAFPLDPDIMSSFHLSRISHQAITPKPFL